VIVEHNGEKRGIVCVLYDLDRPELNRYLVANQFTVEGVKKPRRPDIVAFVNGFAHRCHRAEVTPQIEQADTGPPTASWRHTRPRSPNLSIVQRSYGQYPTVSTRASASLSASRERSCRGAPSGNQRTQANMLKFELESGAEDSLPARPASRLPCAISSSSSSRGDSIVNEKLPGYHQFSRRPGSRSRVTSIRCYPPKTDPETLKGHPSDYGEQVSQGSRKRGIIWHTTRLGGKAAIDHGLFCRQAHQQPAMGNPTMVVVTD